MVIYNKEMKIMKKLIFTTMAISALFLSESCQKENVNDAPKGEGVVFTAYVDGVDPDTKTVIGKNDEGKSVSLWSGQERIWILNGQKGNSSWKKAYKANVSTPVAKADFAEEITTTELTGDAFYAIYPCSASNDAAWTGGAESVTGITLKAEQTPVESTYDPSTHIAVAYTTAGNYSLAFKNAVSYFKLTVGSDNVSEICIFGNASEKITGVFSLKYTPGEGEAAPTVETSEGTLSYVKIISTEANPILKGNTYYIAVLPTDFTTGFSVEMVAGGLKSTCKTTTNQYKMTRNKIVDLGLIEYPTETVYLYPGPWTTDKAVLSVYYFIKDKKVGGWADFAAADADGRWEAQIPVYATHCHYIRSNPNYPHTWEDGGKETGDKLWNRYNNIVLSESNCLTVAVAENGSWYYNLSNYPK